MTDKTIDLDRRRGMEAQKANDLRRLLAEVEANERTLRLRQAMREKLRQLRELDPDTYRENFRTLLPVDALPSDALSDRQLEVNCDAMLKGIARIARRDRGLAKLH